MSARIIAACAVVALTAGAASAQTGQSSKEATPPATKAPAAKQSASPPTKSPPAAGAAKQAGAPQQAKGAPTKRAPTTGAPTAATAKAQAAKDSANKTIIIMREVYASSSGGHRDPFVSLLTTSELRPTMSDLTLNSIFYDALGGSVANVHDASSNKTYGIRVNQQLGRMHVIAIRPSVVVFSIEEFGMDRRDSLFVRPDTSHTRFE